MFYVKGLFCVTNFLQTTSEKLQILLGKMLVVCCVFFHANNNDHGSRWGNTAQALTQWQHLVASREATIALNWVI
jgi:hypothetical protein